MENRFRSLRGLSVFAAISLIGSVFSGGLQAEDRMVKIRGLPNPAEFVDAKIVAERIDKKIDKNSIAVPSKIPPDQQMDAAVGKRFVVVEAVAQDVYPMGRNGFLFTLGTGKQALLWAEDMVDYLAAIKKTARVDMSRGINQAIIGLKGKTLLFAGEVQKFTVKGGKKRGQVFTQVVVSPEKTKKFIVAENEMTLKLKK